MKSTKEYWVTEYLIYLKQAIGIYPTITLLKGELFPTDIRATAYGIVEAVGKLTLVANAKFFPIATASFGFHYVMYFFAIMMAIMAIWGFLTIKDTDRLSLTEIQDLGKNAKQEKDGKKNTKGVDSETIP